MKEIKDFEIVLKAFHDQKKFRMKVALTYQSDRVLRFSITGGLKEIRMEKQLSRKINPWKVTGVNFKMEGSTEAIALHLLMIQDEIDYHLKYRKE